MDRKKIFTSIQNVLTPVLFVFFPHKRVREKKKEISSKDGIKDRIPNDEAI
jgi:hypothetical protein